MAADFARIPDLSSPRRCRRGPVESRRRHGSQHASSRSLLASVKRRGDGGPRRLSPDDRTVTVMRMTRARLMIGGFLLVLWAFALSAAAQQPDNCRLCHGDLDDERLAKPATAFDGDIHADKGFGLRSPAMAATQRPQEWRRWTRTKGILARPSADKSPRFAVVATRMRALWKRYNPRLRVDQVAEYNSSVQRPTPQGLERSEGGDLHKLPPSPRHQTAERILLRASTPSKWRRRAASATQTPRT